MLKGEERDRDKIIRKLIDMQYQRNDVDFKRGTFRVRGERIEIFPTYEEEEAVRIEFFGDIIDGIYIIDPLRCKVKKSLTELIYIQLRIISAKQAIWKTLLFQLKRKWNSR
ncbi:MAG: UvrABC system protein B [Candidatus Methanoperedenaceae archaeon GB50]|nr:MAG: UvrABC system protein B [Candidatus Methanoperedenaceae archaeon GB50]